MEGYGTYLALFAEISVENDKVRVHRISGAVDIGEPTTALVAPALYNAIYAATGAAAALAAAAVAARTRVIRRVVAA